MPARSPIHARTINGEVTLLTSKLTDAGCTGATLAGGSGMENLGAYFSTLRSVLAHVGATKIVITEGSDTWHLTENGGVWWATAEVVDFGAPSIVVNFGGYRAFLRIVTNWARADGKASLRLVVSPDSTNPYKQYELADGSGETLALLRRAAKRHSVVESNGIWFCCVVVILSTVFDWGITQQMSGLVALIYASNLSEETINFSALLYSSWLGVDARQVWVLANLGGNLTVSHTLWSAILAFPSLLAGEWADWWAAAVSVLTAGGLQLAAEAKNASYRRADKVRYLGLQVSEPTRCWLDSTSARTRSLQKTLGRHIRGGKLRHLVQLVVQLVTLPWVVILAFLGFPAWLTCWVGLRVCRFRGVQGLKWPLGKDFEWGPSVFGDQGCHWGKGIYVPTAFALVVGGLGPRRDSAERSGGGDGGGEFNPAASKPTGGRDHRCEERLSLSVLAEDRVSCRPGKVVYPRGAGSPSTYRGHCGGRVGGGCGIVASRRPARPDTDGRFGPR